MNYTSIHIDMRIQLAPLNSLNISDSRYYLCQTLEWDEARPELRALGQSLSTFGILTPLIAHEHEDNRLELVDGFKRAAFAKANGLKDIPVLIIQRNENIENVMSILLSGQITMLGRSIIAKTRFLSTALERGVSRLAIIAKFLQMLDLEPHEATLRNCESIAKLPQYVLDYCDEKRFSMKQCLNLTHYHTDLLEIVFNWQSKLLLSASLIEEFLDRINDILRAEKRTATDFIKTPEVMQILDDATSSPQERTVRLRELLKRRRYPVMTTKNDRLAEIHNSMRLPKNISVKWDETLENCRLEIKFEITRIAEWQKSLDYLQDPSVLKAADTLISEL